MKQIVISARSPAKTVEVPAPSVGRGSVLVRTSFGAVSVGTERAAAVHGQTGWLAKMRARPDKVRQVIDLALKHGVRDTLERVAEVLDRWNATGYSCAGTVVAVGADVPEFRVGDHVACAGGGFATHAEYCVVPRRLLARVPDTLALEHAAFATIGAIAMQGVRQGAIEPGARVAVIGLGIVGQIAAQLATAAGGFVTAIDLRPERVALAEKLGASSGIVLGGTDASERGRQLTGGRGFDVVLLTAATASSEPARLATGLARDRGRLVVVGDVGLDLDRQLMYEKELELRLSRSYGPGRHDESYELQGHDYPYGYVRWTEQRNLESVLALAAARRLDLGALVTHRFTIDEAEAAYTTIVQAQGHPPIGVVLEYPAPAQDAPPAQTVSLTAAPAASDRKGTGVALIGAGSFARSVLLPAFKATAWTPVAIASSTGVGPVQLGRKYGFAYATTDIEAVLRDERVQAVAIATRHSSHAALVTRALRAGKDVFVEKPLAVDLEGLRSVCTAQAESGRRVLVGFNRRFAPLIVRLRAFFGERHGPLVMSMRVNAGPLAQHWSQAAAEGGRIIGEGCHFVDLLTFLAGAPVQSVFAEAVRGPAGAPEENLCATLRFTDGSVATLNYNALGDTALPKEQLEVFGDGKAAALDDFTSLRLVARGASKVHRTKQDKGHHDEIAAFMRALADGSPAPIPFADAVRTTLVTFALLESCRSGRPVEIATELSSA